LIIILEKMNEDKKERYKHIIALLSQGGELTVHDIARVLDVSEMTVRRDLAEMETERIVQRTHGGARIFDPSSLVRENYVVNEQMQNNFQQKNLIGMKAASMVSANETIFLDSGSTTPFIARYLDKDLPVTVLCYTFLNALELYGRKNTNLILSGGFFDKDSTVFHSSEAAVFLKGIRADKAFMSAAGVEARLGLTTFFYFEADIKKLMMQSARQIILVVDSTKFGKSSVSHFGELDQVSMVITDAGVRDEDRAMLSDKGIELVIAEQPTGA
jgi:DeoR family transcriptional regulator, deoxyribose operon repressor